MINLVRISKVSHVMQMVSGSVQTMKCSAIFFWPEAKAIHSRIQFQEEVDLVA
jgi:hypothetical protein